MARMRLSVALSLGWLAACDPAPARVPTPPPVVASAAPSAVASAAPTPSPSASVALPPLPADLGERARVLAQRLLIVDGHIDVPERLEEGRDAAGALTEDVLKRTAKGDFDLERARAGGLDAPFFSIYVPSALQEKKGASRALADKLIAMVEALVARAPAELGLARTPLEVRANSAAGKLTLLMGMENGSPLEGDLASVGYFFGRGIRYITLAHARDNDLADSSFDDRHTHKGLTPFGRQVVLEMNRLGMLVDVSHISDEAFWQVMETSRAPVIASHSSCRHFTPGWPRNMSDPMIQALGQKGGVIMITFGSGFLDAAIQRQQSERWAAMEKYKKEQKLADGDPRLRAFRAEYLKTHPMTFATVDRVADHIDHVVRLVGVEHVGLGSDFDGIGDTLPDGLKDVSQYPNLLRVLLERGYSEADLEKICGGNLLRVWQAVIEEAQREAAP